MRTKDRLAQALVEAGLSDMAERAARGHYDDFESELDMPATALVHELSEIASPDAMALRNRVMKGEFDSTREEAEAWARSPDGKATFQRLNKRL